MDIYVENSCYLIPEREVAGDHGEYQSILMDNNSRIMKELKELQDAQKNVGNSDILA